MYFRGGIELAAPVDPQLHTSRGRRRSQSPGNFRLSSRFNNQRLEGGSRVVVQRPSNDKVRNHPVAYHSHECRVPMSAQPRHSGKGGLISYLKLHPTLKRSEGQGSGPLYLAFLLPTEKVVAPQACSPSPIRLICSMGVPSMGWLRFSVEDAHVYVIRAEIVPGCSYSRPEPLVKNSGN